MFRIRWYLIFFLNESSDVEKNVLCNGLNFPVKLKSTEYSKFLLPFQLLFRDVNQENLCSENWNARLLDITLSSCKSFSSHRSPFENLTTSESKTLNRLSKNKNIVIQKADKGNTYPYTG